MFEPPLDGSSPSKEAENCASAFWKGLESAPLFLPAAAFLAGTLLPVRQSLWPAAILPAALTLLVCAAWAFYRFSRLKHSLLLCLAGFLVAGWFWAWEAVSARSARILLLQPLTDAGVAPEWTGYLYRDPEITPERTILCVSIQSAEWHGRPYPMDVRARVSVYPSVNGAVEFPFGELIYGDVLSFRAPLSRPRNFRNPGMYDYAGNLERDGVLLTGSLKSVKMVSRKGRGAGDRLTAVAYSFRRSFRAFLRREFTPLPGGADITAILDALLFGEQSGLSRDVVRLFQETGTYHIFVVSGFNTTLIAIFLTGLLRLLRVPMPVVVMVCGLALLLYALMTGLEPPVVRASILSLGVLLAQAIFRRGDLLNSLSLAALVSLLLWPEVAGDASFLLTYLACLAILALGLPAIRVLLDPFHLSMRSLFSSNTLLTRPVLLEQIARRLRFETELAVEWLVHRAGPVGIRLKWMPLLSIRLVTEALYHLLGLLLVSLAIHVVLSPLMAYYFNRANVAAYLANLFVVPALTLVLLAALILGGTLWILGWTWYPWTFFTAWLVEGTVGGLKAVSGIGGWHWRVATPPLPWVWLYFVLLLAACLPVAKRLRLASAAAALLMLPSFWWNPFPMQRQAPGKMEAYVLDVGQGESVFIISPEGRTMLVDAGGFLSSYAEDETPQRGWQAPRFDVGEEIVCRFLWALRVPSIDYLVLTHPQLDHAGGIPAVLDNFKVRRLAGPEPASKLAEILPHATAIAAARGLAWTGLRRGTALELGSCRISVLSPPDSLLGPFSRVNDRSVVIKIVYGGKSLLMTGDIEKLVERELTRDCAELRADILKVPHHGSATSSTEPFLDCVQPRWALISAGYNNRFNHPSPDVLERLRGRSVEFLDTSRSGALLVMMSESAARVRPALQPDGGPPP